MPFDDEEIDMGPQTFRIAFGTVLATLALAASAEPPSGATGLCKDGSFTETQSKKGACAGHKGLKKWYGTRGAPAASDARSTQELAPVKPTQSIGSTASGDRLNNTQPTDSSNTAKR
jgi:hypothetical protein